MIGTQLNHLLTGNAAALLGQDEVQKLLDALAGTHPQLVGGLVPKLLPLQTVTAVLQRLLEEAVPIRDLRRIVAGLAAIAGKSPDPAELTELLRPSARRADRPAARRADRAADRDRRRRRPRGSAGERGARRNPGSPYPFEPMLAGRVADAVRAAVRTAGCQAAQTLRGHHHAAAAPAGLYGLLHRGQLPDAAVLSFTDIPDGKAIAVAATVGGAAAPALEAAA